jgi:hypothetical protein
MNGCPNTFIDPSGIVGNELDEGDAQGGLGVYSAGTTRSTESTLVRDHGVYSALISL